MTIVTPSFRRAAGLIAAALLALPLLTTAQTAPQVYKNNGGTSNSTFALGNSDYARKTQLLYDPQSITNPMAGQMRRVYFAYGSSDQALGVILDSLTIRVGQTTDVTIPSTTFYTGLTRVAYKSTITIPPGTSGAWFGIDLDSTFTYDPSLSLIVEITYADSRKPTTGAPSNFGTSGDNLISTRKKLCDPNPYATVSSVSSSTWQHFGFDVLTLGLSTDREATALQAFPSPTHDRLTVRWTDAARTAPATLTLTDALGRTVRRATVEASALQAGHTLSVEGLPTGTYVLTVVQNDRRLVRRVTVE